MVCVFLLFSFVAGYSRASARNDAQAYKTELGEELPIWLTEFGYGLNPPGQCLLPELTFGAVHGAFHAARILAAIEQPCVCAQYPPIMEKKGRAKA